jgi:hypothetical protein
LFSQAEAWNSTKILITVARAAGVPVIYTTPVSRSDGADGVMLRTDLDPSAPPVTLPS